MKSIIAMKTILEITSIHKCRNKLTLKTFLNRKWLKRKILFSVQTIMTMTHHHLTLNTMYWSLTATSKANFNLLLFVMTLVCQETCFLMSKISHNPLLKLIHYVHNHQYLNPAFPKTIILFQILKLLSNALSVASMKIKFSFRKRNKEK